MSQEESTCQLCGQPATVSIRQRDVAGKPVFARYCLACAAQLDAEADARRREALEGDPEEEGLDMEKPLLPTSHLLIAVGLFIALLGVVGGHLGIHGSPGFGWYQTTVLVCAVILVIIGGITGVDLIKVIAAVVVVLTACSDLLGLHGGPEMGWKKWSAVAIGSAMTTIGFLLARSGKRAGEQGVPPPQQPS
jgi:hypothetical protein